jgi:hypothetical protein
LAYVRINITTGGTMETMEKKELKKYLKTQIELTSDLLKKIE